MNTLTTRQRNAIAAAPANRRRTMRQGFINQNRQIPPVISYGISRAKNPPLANNRRINRRVPNPNLNINSVIRVGTGVLMPITINNSFWCDTREIAPKHIEAIKNIAQYYEEYAISSISFTFEPAVSDQTVGTIYLGCTSSNAQAPSKVEELIRLPQLYAGSAHKPSRPVIPSPLHLNKWFRTTDAKEAFGKLVTGYTGTFTGALGVINCTYNIKLRGITQ